MTRHTLSLAVVLLVGIALAACNPGPEGGGPPCSASQLAKPVNQSPSDGAVVAGHPVFDWSDPSPGCMATGYELQILTEAQAQDVLAGQDVELEEGAGKWLLPAQTSWEPGFLIAPGNVVFWRVRGTAADGEGPWSDMTHFGNGELCAQQSPEYPLPAPDPLTPWWEMFVLEPAWLRWQGGSGMDCFVDGYQLQIMRALGSTQMEVDLRLEGIREAWQLGDQLENCGQYHYQVAAFSGEMESPFSEPRGFYLNLGGACTESCQNTAIIPELVAPEDGAHVGETPTLSPPTGLLQWNYNEPCLPLDYEVQLSTDPTFEDAGLSAITAPPTSWQMSWGPDVPLEPLTQYWWRVRARVMGQNPADFSWMVLNGEFTETRTFITGPDCAPGEIRPVRLLSPPDASLTNTMSPGFAWTPGPDGCLAPRYCVHVSGADDWTSRECVSGLQSPLPELPEPCVTYEWYVTPGRDLPSLRSETWSFTARPGPLACFGDRIHALALQEVGCRQGPSFEWDVLGYVLADEVVEVFGRNMAGTWLAVDNLDNPGQRCWVPMEALQLSPGTGELRILFEPVPGSTAAGCRQDLGQTACVQAGGTYFSFAGGGTCVCP